MEPSADELLDKRFVSLLPEHLQLKILTLVTEPPAGSSSAASEPASVPVESTAAGAAPPLPAAGITAAVLRLAAHGFGWCDGVLSEAAVDELLASPTRQQLQAAGVGASFTRRVDPSVRGDSIAWVPLSSQPDEIRRVLSCSVQGLSDLSMEAGEGVADRAPGLAWGGPLSLPGKCMLAHYPEGAKYGKDRSSSRRYMCPRSAPFPPRRRKPLLVVFILTSGPLRTCAVRHSDVSVAVPRRRVTAILYLNKEWAPGDGGELVLYPPTSSFRPGADAVGLTRAEASFVVEPRAGRLLLFRSEIEHEVKPSLKPRWAISAWISVANDAPPPSLRPLPLRHTTRRHHTPPPPPPPAPLSSPSSVAPHAERPLPAAATAVAATAAVETAAAREAAERAAAAMGVAVEVGAMGVAVKAGAMAAATEPLAPPQPTAATTAPLPSIFVSIASYRDEECSHTIGAAFRSAASPGRVYIGACLQRDPSHPEESVRLDALPPDCAVRVTLLELHWRHAQGPGWARFLIERLLYPTSGPEGAGTTYYLQIDSHTRFAPGWDDSLIGMLDACGSPQPVLSTYPLPYEGAGDAAVCSQETRATLLCAQPAGAPAFGATDQMLRFRARLLARQPTAPLPSAFWAAVIDHIFICI